MTGESTNIIADGNLPVRCSNRKSLRKTFSDCPLQNNVTGTLSYCRLTSEEGLKKIAMHEIGQTKIIATAMICARDCQKTQSAEMKIMETFFLHQKPESLPSPEGPQLS